MILPLEGIKVVSLAYLYPGPFCTMLLGDLGAEVIVVEPPGGDLARGGIPGFFSAINRNKKSIVLNLKQEHGRRICYELVNEADVFLEGFRPGKADELGIGYSTLREINPQIIYCSISGFGQNGPYCRRPAHDTAYQGMAGILGYAHEPSNPDIAVADLSSGLFATIAILVALLAREKYGKGQYIDISMADVLLYLNSTAIGIFFASGTTHRVTRAGGGVFKTEDNKCLTISIAGENHFWRKLCNILGHSDVEGLSYQQRLQIAENLNSRIAETISTKSLEEWLDIFIKNDIPCGPVLTLDEVVKDAQFLYRGMITEINDAKGNKVKQVSNPIKYSEFSTSIRMPPAELGQHTAEILKGLGYSQEKIEMLRKEGVI